MPFPGAEEAIAGDEKLLQYLLNPMHPIGAPKGCLAGFNRLYGGKCGYAGGRSDSCRKFRRKLCFKTIAFWCKI